ncbi:hypothetical protein OESDEN_25549 [Oesophagostomum dentatum]|uniref:Uncharacterized protein n=1 Tax=Oesophagostomum dentatum TaxID=61180 RepID=A0A0B1RUV8_OESDE|nr:hypothetical protein OESDEN_25549 [Oesophagostomum dentatum]
MNVYATPHLLCSTQFYREQDIIFTTLISRSHTENFEPYDESANAVYDTKIHELSEKQTKLSLQYRELQNELKSLSSVETTQRLRELIKELKEKVAALLIFALFVSS